MKKRHIFLLYNLVPKTNETQLPELNSSVNYNEDRYLERLQYTCTIQLQFTLEWALNPSIFNFSISVVLYLICISTVLSQRTIETYGTVPINNFDKNRVSICQDFIQKKGDETKISVPKEYSHIFLCYWYRHLVLPHFSRGESNTT